MNDMNLVDFPIVSRKFTWRRGKPCSRLDKVLINPIWNVKYPNLHLRYLKCSKSDHIPLLLDSKDVNRGPKPFRSLDVWFSHGETLGTNVYWKN